MTAGRHLMAAKNTPWNVPGPGQQGFQKGTKGRRAPLPSTAVAPAPEAPVVVQANVQELYSRLHDKLLAKPPMVSLRRAAEEYVGEEHSGFEASGNAISIGDGNVQVVWDTRSDPPTYDVVISVMASAGSYWDPPEYKNETIHSTTDPSEAVERAYDAYYDGVESSEEPGYDPYDD